MARALAACRPTLSRFAAGFVAELRLAFGARRYQLMLFLLLSMSWLGMDVYRQMTVLGLPLAIIDHDNSKISRTLRQFVAANREVKLVELPVNTLAEAEAQLINGDLAAVLYIPADFSTAIKKGKKGSVVFSADMSNIVIGKNLYKAVSRSVSTVAGGVQLTVVKKLGEQKDKAMSRVAPISVDEAYAFNPGTNYGVYIMPMIIFFFLHIYVLILCVSAYLPPWKPATTAELLGMFAAIVAVGAVVGLLFAYVYLPFENLPPESGVGLVLLNLLLLLVLDVALAAMFNAVLPTAMMAFEVTIVLGMLSLMFCGATWPTDAFPAAIAFIGKLLPFTPFTRALRIVLNYPASVADLAPMLRQYLGQAALGAMLIAGGLGLKAAIRRRKGQAA